MAYIIYPNRLVKLAKLYCIAKNQADDYYPFDGLTQKQKPEDKINHQAP